MAIVTDSIHSTRNALRDAHILLKSSRERYAEPGGEPRAHAAIMDCKCVIARQWVTLNA